MNRKRTPSDETDPLPPLHSPMPRSPVLDREEPELRQERDIPSEEGRTERAGAAQRRSAPADARERPGQPSSGPKHGSPAKGDKRSRVR
jgi:hypothetical protein